MGWNTKRQPAAITDWSQLPLMVGLEQVAGLFGRSTRSIERLVRLNRMRPMPYMTRPMVWSRADLEAAWKGERPASSQSRMRRIS